MINEAPVIVENPTVRPILDEAPEEPEELPVFDSEGIPLNEDWRQPAACLCCP